MIDAERYTYKIVWSEEDGEYAGTVLEFPSLSHLDADPIRALNGIIELVRGILDDMERNEELPPEPMGARTFSGNFALRMTPEQHRRLAMEAAEQHVSINHLICSRI